MRRLTFVEENIKSSPLERGCEGQEQWQGCVFAIDLTIQKHTPPPSREGNRAGLCFLNS
jgi:hypothetical protein